MPIIDVRSHSVAEGKHAEAMDWLKRIIGHHTSQKIKARIFRPINGDVMKVFTEIEFVSLAAMEEYTGAFMKSDAWTKDFSKEWGKGLFTSTVRHQYRVVE